ncbi:MAG: glycosyltransferase family 2 protein [Verrucomicrobia bacterium]|nr:glycosyltransferase family 2 protein [Verrucomicrobiota bacterium]MDE3098380.1 glycosyltransferase family 2 protein [Verrucomicrobiota bacterium]
MLLSRCCAVIPCFNEAATIESVVAGVKRLLTAVIVVDDGSEDGGGALAGAAGAKVIVLERNRGKGAALREGWRCARQAGFDWVLMLDADGQHSSEDIPKLFECARRTGALLVVGNRMKQCGRMSPLRRVVNRRMSGHLSALTGVAVPDSQCGFRLAHLQTLLDLPLTANHFEIESEMITAFAAAGETIAFVPIAALSKNRPSKIRPLLDTARWFWWRLRQPAALRAAMTPTLGGERRGAGGFPVHGKGAITP